MTVVEENVLVPPAGYAASEVGLFLAQLDDQNLRLIEDTRGADAAELAWQPAPGMNTIGMLLAHIAVVEVFWISVASSTPYDCETVLGHRRRRRRDARWKRAPHRRRCSPARRSSSTTTCSRGRAPTPSASSQAWTDADLDVRIERTRRRDRSASILNRRWILYHVLEHEAGHYGQINLLRHLYRLAVRAADVAMPGRAVETLLDDPPGYRSARSPASCGSSTSSDRRCSTGSVARPRRSSSGSRDRA